MTNGKHYATILASSAVVAVAAASVTSLLIARAEPGGATRESFAFAGRLTPAQPGSHDFTFTFRAEGSGSLCPVMVNDVTVDDAGEFEATIPLDACASALFDGTDVVMDIAVDGAPIVPSSSVAVDGAFPIHPVPYARYADRAGANECPTLLGTGGERRAYRRVAGPDGIRVCSNGNDQMVGVGDFWVDRYEVIVVDDDRWSAGTCTGSGNIYGIPGGTPDGTGDPPSSFGNDGSWTAPLYACSVAGARPSGSMTWFQAQQACAHAGKHLCRDHEWQAAVAGTDDGPGCNTATSGPRETSMAGTTPGGAGSCISRWGAEDMIGNLEEWVADWQVAGRAFMMTDGDGLRQNWPAQYGDGMDRTINVNGTGALNVTGTQEGLPAAPYRGGGFDRGQEAGAFAWQLDAAPAYQANNIGFRCCAGP